MSDYVIGVLYPLWLRKTTRYFLWLLLAGGLVASAAGFFAWQRLGDIDQALGGRQRLHIPQLQRTSVGGAQTLLLLGTDERYDELKQGQRGRSDTMMLVRLDPDSPQISMISIPRDLRVPVRTSTGGLEIAKLNSAYTEKGSQGVVESMHRILGVDVNHVFEVNFAAFRGAVDALGCAWVDVDRRYLHRNQPGAEQWSEIDLQPGYQRLCGVKALQYVRYRHTDSDFIRAKRQQDFLRQLASQFGAGDLLQNRDQLLGVAGKYVRTDLQGRLQIAELLRLMAFCSGKPVVQVPWQGEVAMIGGVSYVVSSPAQMRSSIKQWQHPPVTKQPIRAKKKAKKKARLLPSMEGARVQGSQEQTAVHQPNWPVMVPALRPEGSMYTDYSPRGYIINQDGMSYPAYRLTLVDDQGYYWGVQGTAWSNPPILNMHHENSKIGSRQVQLYWDGRRLKRCALQSGGWWYWVENSLARSLDNAQMMSVCGSLTLHP